MTRASKIIIVLAVFTATIPLLGFPGIVKDWLTVFLGLGIACITYWAEKHAKFCTECKLSSDTTPHVHTAVPQAFDRHSKTDDTVTRLHTTDALPGNLSVRSDIVSRRSHVESETSQASSPEWPSSSPFSFDAKEAKQKTVRRGGRRKAVVVQ